MLDVIICVQIYSKLLSIKPYSLDRYSGAQRETERMLVEIITGILCLSFLYSSYATYKWLSTSFKVTAKFVCEDGLHLQTHYTVHAIHSNHAAYIRPKATALDRVYVFSDDHNEQEQINRKHVEKVFNFCEFSEINGVLGKIWLLLRVIAFHDKFLYYQYFRNRKMALYSMKNGNAEQYYNYMKRCAVINYVIDVYYELEMYFETLPQLFIQIGFILYSNSISLLQMVIITKTFFGSLYSVLRRFMRLKIS